MCDYIEEYAFVSGDVIVIYEVSSSADLIVSFHCNYSKVWT